MQKQKPRSTQTLRLAQGEASSKYCQGKARDKMGLDWHLARSNPPQANHQVYGSGLAPYEQIGAREYKYRCSGH